MVLQGKFLFHLKHQLHSQVLIHDMYTILSPFTVRVDSLVPQSFDSHFCSQSPMTCLVLSQQYHWCPDGGTAHINSPREENTWYCLHNPDLGVCWVYMARTAEVNSVRRDQKLSPCQRETVLAVSKVDRLLSKDNHISGAGGASLATDLRKSKKWCTVAVRKRN